MLVKAQEQRLRAQGYRPRPAVKKAPAAIDARRAYAAHTAELQRHMQSGGLTRIMALGMPWSMHGRMLDPALMMRLLARRPA
jgi:hypothetical protein